MDEHSEGSFMPGLVLHSLFHSSGSGASVFS